MPRFVLLRHETPADFEKPSHWDFMLEMSGVLRTWELRALPACWARALGIETFQTAEALPAIALPDHRLTYLDYEGPLSGNRGSVQRCDRGEYRLLQQREALFVIELFNARLNGIVDLHETEIGYTLTASIPNL